MLHVLHIDINILVIYENIVKMNNANKITQFSFVKNSQLLFLSLYNGPKLSKNYLGEVS